MRVQRNKTTIHAYGYDLGTLQEMARSRQQHCSTRIDRMNLIAMPELSNETVSQPARRRAQRGRTLGGGKLTGRGLVVWCGMGVWGRCK